MSGTLAAVTSEHVALSILLIGVLLFFVWFMWRFEQDEKRAKAKRIEPEVDTSDPYAPRCPFCMTPIVDERCDNLDCWFMGHIVPIPEFREKRPVVHMGPRNSDMATTRILPDKPTKWDLISEAQRAWYTMYSVPPALTAEVRALPPGAYLDMSMATPQVMGLTAEQIQNMTMEEYAQLRPQLLQRARYMQKNAKALHWDE